MTMVIEEEFAKANELLLSNRLGEAKEAFLRLHTSPPPLAHPGIRHNLALCEELIRNWSAAHDLYRQNVDEFPEYAPSHVGLANICFYRNDAAGMKKHLMRAHELNPLAPQTMILLSEAACIEAKGGFSEDALSWHILALDTIENTSSTETIHHVQCYYESGTGKEYHQFSSIHPSHHTSSSASGGDNPNEDCFPLWIRLPDQDQDPKGKGPLVASGLAQRPASTSGAREILRLAKGAVTSGVVAQDGIVVGGSLSSAAAAKALLSQADTHSAHGIAFDVKRGIVACAPKSAAMCLLDPALLPPLSNDDMITAALFIASLTEKLLLLHP
jgi:tetratricopeptide (TPR) repeat protein